MRRKFTYSLTLCVLICLMFLSCKEKNTDINLLDKKEISDISNFEIEVDVSLTNDGASLGTVFQITDDKGDIISYAGFSNGINTLSTSNKSILQFAFPQTFDPNSIKTIDIGNPFPENTEWTRVNNINNRLIAYNYEAKNSYKVYNDSTGIWENYNKLPASDYKLMDIQVLGDSIITVFQDAIYWGNVELYREKNPNEKRILAFGLEHGNFFIFRYSINPSQRNEIVYGDLTKNKNIPKLNIKNSYLGFCEIPEQCPPYAWAWLNNKFIVSTNLGHIYNVDSTGIDYFFKWDYEKYSDSSWQVYSILNIEDRFYMGHYPSGNILSFKYNNESIEEIEVPYPQTAFNIMREAQTLAVYSGYLLCGLWPWGEVWGYSINSKTWHWINRFFKHPDIRLESAPFVERIKNLEDNAVFNNKWGQRIIDLVPYKNLLIVNTGFKNSISETDKKYLFAQEMEQYGKMYSVEIPYNMAVEIKNKRNTILKFVSKNEKIEIWQDNELLSRMDVAIKPQKGFFSTAKSGIMGQQNIKLNNTIIH
jgi:hypothetical protein